MANELNCWIKFREGFNWVPAYRDGDQFFDSKGIRIVTPHEYRDATHSDIVKEMREKGMVLIAMDDLK